MTRGPFDELKKEVVPMTRSGPMDVLPAKMATSTF